MKKMFFELFNFFYIFNAALNKKISFNEALKLKFKKHIKPNNYAFNAALRLEVSMLRCRIIIQGNTLSIKFVSKIAIIIPVKYNKRAC